MALSITIRSMIFLLLMLAVFLTVPVLIGVYVYRDARRRNMNAVLWTLIAIIAPALIGFIIYLLVRGNYPDLECPQCGNPVTEQYVACPQCGAKLRPACPSCARPVEPDWKVCPRCAASLDGVELYPSPPLRRRDKALSKILIAVIVVPVAFIALTTFSFTAIQSSVSSSTLQEIAFADYLQEQTSEEIRSTVFDWVNSLDRLDCAYALRYDYSTDLDTGYDYFYLIYIPGAGGGHNSFGTRSGLFGTALELSVESSRKGSIVYCMQTHADKPPVLRITLDGKRIRCDVQVVDYNPTLFFIEPNYAQAEPGAVELPERLSVVKLVGGESIGTADDGTAVAEASKNMGVVEVTDKDLMLKILTCIDSGERVPMGQIPDFDFRDGFEIIVEYQIHDDHIMHDDMARHMVFMTEGVCYLNDDRVRNTAYGSSFRVMDENFYGLLENLFR